MMLIDNKFDLGQIVYLKTDIEQRRRIVVAMQIGADMGIMYRLCLGTEVDWHYDVEISEEKDIMLTSTN